MQVLSTTRSALARSPGTITLARQQRFERGAVGLRSAAAEILNEELTHCLYVSFILALNERVAGFDYAGVAAARPQIVVHRLRALHLADESGARFPLC